VFTDFQCDLNDLPTTWLDMQFIKWSYLPNWIGGSNRPGVIPPTPQRLSAPPNMPEEHSPSDMLPKGGNPWDGRRAPGVLNTFVVFFLFFHLALRFWNHTCEWISYIYVTSCHTEGNLLKLQCSMARKTQNRLKTGSSFLIYFRHVTLMGHAVTPLVEALCEKSEGRGFDSG